MAIDYRKEIEETLKALEEVAKENAKLGRLIKHYRDSLYAIIRSNPITPEEIIHMLEKEPEIGEVKVELPEVDWSDDIEMVYDDLLVIANEEEQINNELIRTESVLRDGTKLIVKIAEKFGDQGLEIIKELATLLLRV